MPSLVRINYPAAFYISACRARSVLVMKCKRVKMEPDAEEEPEAPLNLKRPKAEAADVKAEPEKEELDPEYDPVKSLPLKHDDVGLPQTSKSSSSSLRTPPGSSASSSSRTHVPVVAAEAVEESDYTWKVVYCPGCLSLVEEDVEYYRTQRTVWHLVCWDNRPEFPTFDICPYCKVKVEPDLEQETISASGHAWHSSCLEEYLDEKTKKQNLNNNKKMICPGCRQEASRTGRGVVTSKSKQKWCQTCWDDRCSSGRSFQQARNM